ncbi:helix-turn-helix domain-containing protein [Streptomyces novaecaesareae]|uniref:helix-turn-helix domain-containing protein n=1 Tax=Streptomyces novaecaesareae TaxID=68244 RepID=UPI0004AA783E|nr:helix-turn-helix transcriptional regulator [Streptomyces novaecaesareae]
MAEADVDAQASPQVRFGQELRRSRRAKRWSQTEAAGHLGYSGAHISYVENGKRSPTRPLAVKADEVFGSGQRFYELWRRFSRAALLEGFAEFADAEARCRRLRTVGLIVVPGLLQTPAYARALAQAAVRRGAITPTEADERIDYLALRQEILGQKNPPALHAVIEEGVLLRPVGGPQVMAEQLRHLEDLAERPNVTVQIAPFSMGENLSFTLPVVLLNLPDHTVVGYAESTARGHLERSRATVAGWESEYDQLLVEALPKAASQAMIRRARKEFRS